MGNKVAIVNQSTAGGLIIGPGSSTVMISGQSVSLDGDMVMAHGVSPHDSSMVIAMNNTTTFIGGQRIVVNGDFASCLHFVSSNSTVSIG
jgi:uncharacterized Zn-binding protein involved in type VI secretion